MKITRILFAMLLVLTMLFGAAVAVNAQAGTWVTGIMIQNQSTDQPAHITVTFYWAEGTPLAGQVAHTFEDTIPANGSVSYYVPTSAKTAGLPSDFVGSAVVSSDQPVVANLNTQVPSGSGAAPTDPNRVGTASGVLEPSTTLYFTQVMKEYWGWNSYVAVQNTSANTANVTIKYYNQSDGSEVVAAQQTVTIHPYSTKVFRQSENAGLPASFSGSAVVTGDQPLAGVANFFNDGTTAAKAAFNSYNAFSGGATKLYVPRLVRNYYDYQGGLTIQNVGTAATNVTITYYFGGNTYTQTINNIQPNACKILYMPNVTELGTVAGSGSAIIVSSGQPIVATVNEDNRTGAALPGHEGRSVTYNAIPDGKQTTAVLFPQVTSKFYGYCSGVQIQNVGAAPANVTATFSMPGHTDIVVTAVVQPNASKDWFAPNVVTYPDFNGSVVITSDQPIVGIANTSVRTDIDTRYPANYGDSYLMYNGVNK